MLAAGVVITCIVIGLGFYIARESRDGVSTGVSQIGKLNAEFTESDKVMYDSLEVSGSEVINVVNKFKSEEMGIKVITKKDTTYYINSLNPTDTELSKSSTASIKDAQKITNNSYINPNGRFMGEVLRDDNHAVIGIKFTQS